MNYFCSRILRLLFLIIAGFCLVVPSYGQAVDPNFYSVITNNDYAVINASAVQADGKVVIAGAFGQANGFRQSGVARLLPNGKTDETFQPVGLTNGNYAGFVYDLKIQPDGKILIAGNLSSVNGQTRRGIARLNTDGSLDTVFAAVLTEIGYSLRLFRFDPRQIG